MSAAWDAVGPQLVIVSEWVNTQVLSSAVFLIFIFAFLSVFLVIIFSNNKNLWRELRSRCRVNRILIGQVARHTFLYLLPPFAGIS